MEIEFVGSIGLIAFVGITKFVFSEKTRRNWWVPVLLAVFGVCACQSYYGLFGAGGALRVCARGHRPLPDWLVLCLLVIALFLGTLPSSTDASWLALRPLIMAAPVEPALPWAHSPSSFWHAWGAILVVIVIQGSKPLQLLFGARFAQWLGAISFPLYLLHIPILMVVGCPTFLFLMNLRIPYAPAALLSWILFAGSSIMVANFLLYVLERPTIAISGFIGRTIDVWVTRAGVVRGTRDRIRLGLRERKKNFRPPPVRGGRCNRLSPVESPATTAVR